jgi:Cdc6-like AAA superfamily ATPase
MNTPPSVREQPLSRNGRSVDAVFTPATPIRSNKLFAGRKAQRDKLYETILEPGRHAILYGERGVGKTSLANMVAEQLRGIRATVPIVSADSQDTFATLWGKILRALIYLSSSTPDYILPGRKKKFSHLPEHLNNGIGTDDIVRALSDLPLTVVVVDEFDRLQSPSLRLLMADTIKALSDRGVGATLLLVGVAHDIHELIGQHPSIERSLRQIRLDRMSPSELEEILDNGFRQLELTISPKIRENIVTLSHGFPHYTHALGRYTAYYAIQAGVDEVTEDHFREAVKESIEDTYQTIKDNYLRGALSRSRGNVMRQLIVAAALAQEDNYGSFEPRELLVPLRVIGAPRFIRMLPIKYYLGKLTSPDAGAILEAIGRPHNTRYRFRNALVQPYIIMTAFRRGHLPDDHLKRLLGEQ